MPLYQKVLLYLLGALQLLCYIPFWLFHSGYQELAKPLLIVTLPFYVSALFLTIPTTAFALIFLHLFFRERRERKEGAVHYLYSALLIVVGSAVWLISLFTGWIIAV